jgi:hypothetical protein
MDCFGPSPAFVGVTVEEVGVAALLEDGGHLLGLVVVQLDLAITLIMIPHSHLSIFSQCTECLVVKDIS